MSTATPTSVARARLIRLAHCGAGNLTPRLHYICGDIWHVDGREAGDACRDHQGDLRREYRDAHFLTVRPMKKSRFLRLRPFRHG